MWFFLLVIWRSWRWEGSIYHEAKMLAEKVNKRKRGSKNGGWKTLTNQEQKQEFLELKMAMKNMMKWNFLWKIMFFLFFTINIMDTLISLYQFYYAYQVELLDKLNDKSWFSWMYQWNYVLVLVERISEIVYHLNYICIGYYVVVFINLSFELCIS